MKSSKKTEEDHSAKKADKHGVPPPPGHAGPADPEITSGSGDALPAETEKAPDAAGAQPVDDRLLRLQADFDNFRKRVLREKEDIYRRANEDIMEELLPVLDHLELATAAIGDSEKYDSISKGFLLVGEQLCSVLKKYGLSPVETGGVDFDPNLHEAILHMPSPDVPENAIISRTRAGYMLGGRLLRAAQVVVSSGAPETGSTDDE